MEKKFEIAGFQNIQGSVKGKGKIQGRSIFLRNSGDFELTEFEIAGFDFIILVFVLCALL